MSYYKYAERDENSRVNWGDVSKKWSESILKVEEDRETKRQEIQTKTDELTEKIIGAPMGDNEGVNSWYSGFADLSSNYLLDANRRLKSGNLSVRDYNTIMANLTQGTERMTTLAKDYSQHYAEKMERLQNEDSQQAEIAMMELAEGFSNFTNTQGVVNPRNGMISIVRNDTGDTVTIPEMRSYINMKYDRYDVDGSMNTAVKTLGDQELAIMRRLRAEDGVVKTRSDVRLMEEWSKAKDALLDAELTNGLNVSSILTEEVGGYNVITKPKFDESGNLVVNDKDVLFVLDPTQPGAGYRVPLYGANFDSLTENQLDAIFGTDLSDAQRTQLIEKAKEQKQVARNWLDTDLESRLAVKETAYTPTGRGGGGTDYTRKDVAAKETAYTAATAWMDLAYARTPAAKEAAENQLMGTSYVDDFGNSQTITGVDSSSNKDRVTITTRNRDGEETTQQVFYKSGNQDLSPLQWAQSGSIFYQDQVPFVLQNVPGMKTKDGRPVYEDMTLGVAPERPAVDVQTPEVVDFGVAQVGRSTTAPTAPQYFNDTAKTGDNDDEIMATQQAVIGALGAMGVDASAIKAITETETGNATETEWYKDDNAVLRFFVPGVTADPIFIPNNQAGHAALVDIMTKIPELIRTQRPLTVEQALKDYSHVSDMKRYNKDEYEAMLGAYPVRVVADSSGNQQVVTNAGSMAQFNKPTITD